jgi:hypothetical protein
MPAVRVWALVAWVVFIVVAFIVGPVVVVCWGWVSWFRNRPKPLPYGAAWTLMAFTLASFSALLNLGTALQAFLIRGFRHYDPVLLQRYRWGLGLSLIAFVFSFPGKNTESPLRLKAPVLSPVCC